MKLVNLKEYSEELSLLIDDDIQNCNGYKISSFENASALLKDCIDIIEENTGFFWGILIDGKLAGFFGYYAKNDKENDDYYFLTRTYLLQNYRSTGINKKIKTAISDVFNHYRLPLYARVHKDNQRSILSVIKAQGVFQSFYADLIVFIISYGELIPEKQLSSTVNKLKNKVNTLLIEPVSV